MSGNFEGFGVEVFLMEGVFERGSIGMVIFLEEATNVKTFKFDFLHNDIWVFFKKDVARDKFVVLILGRMYRRDTRFTGTRTGLRRLHYGN